MLAPAREMLVRRSLSTAARRREELGDEYLRRDFGRDGAADDDEETPAGWALPYDQGVSL